VYRLVGVYYNLQRWSCVRLASINCGIDAFR